MEFLIAVIVIALITNATKDDTSSSLDNLNSVGSLVESSAFSALSVAKASAAIRDLGRAETLRDAQVDSSLLEVDLKDSITQGRLRAEQNAQELDRLEAEIEIQAKEGDIINAQLRRKFEQQIIEVEETGKAISSVIDSVKDVVQDVRDFRN